METFHFAANHSSISYWWLHAHYAMLATAMFFIALDGDCVIYNPWTHSYPPLDSAGFDI